MYYTVNVSSNKSTLALNNTFDRQLPLSQLKHKEKKNFSNSNQDQNFIFFQFRNLLAELGPFKIFISVQAFSNRLRSKWIQTFWCIFYFWWFKPPQFGFLIFNANSIDSVKHSENSFSFINYYFFLWNFALQQLHQLVD